MRILRVLRAAVSMHKYPRYLSDFWVHLVLVPLWRAHGVKIGARVYWHGAPIITMTQRSSICVGDDCTICSRSTDTALGVNHPVILRTLQAGARLVIGSGVRMSGTTICAVEEVLIGDRCVIGANVTIADTDFHALDPVVRSSENDALGAAHRAVYVGNDVFIGGGVMILKGVRIGQGAVIGAGSIVTGDVAVGAIMAGNPARQIGRVDWQDGPR